MGYSYGKNDAPIMCFNAANSWKLGWYSDKAVTLNKTNKTSFVGVLGGISDYSDSNNTVLVKLNNLNSTSTSRYDDYYVNFNRQSGINSGTLEGGDQVTVVQGGEGTGYAETDLVAKLSAGEEYTIINFDDSGEAATITVNTIGGSADVSICIAPCPSLTPSPTQSPTASPMTTIPGDVVPSCQLGKFLEFCAYNRDCCSGRCVSKVCRTSPTSGRASRAKLAGRDRAGAAGLALKAPGGGRIRG
jgi:hypothetical protein